MNYFDIKNMIEAGMRREDMIESVRKGAKCGPVKAEIRVDKAIARYESENDATEQTNAESTTQNSTAMFDNMKHGDVVFTGTEQRGNGTVILDAVVACLHAGKVSSEDIMKKYGLNPSEWEVTSFKTSTWQAQKKGGIVTPLYSSKLTVRPRKFGGYTYEDIDNYFKDKEFSIPVPKMTPVGNKNGYILEIPIPDLHVGLMAWGRETGERFDLKIVRKQFAIAIDNVISKINILNIPVKEIKLVTLGDLLHVDNDNQTTTKGTFQQVDARVPKLIDTAIDMMGDAVLKLEQVAPVEYIYIPGNHDQNLGYAVAKATACSFKNHSNVTFDIGPNPHKYRKIGANLLGWTHGSMTKKNLDMLLFAFNIEQTGVRQRYMHVGHLHSSSGYVSPTSGVYVEHLDSLCAASAWEQASGYGATPLRYINCFMWTEAPTPPERLIGAVE